MPKIEDKNKKEILKKFLWPVTQRKKAYLKYVIKSILIGINGVIHILFLEKVTNAIELLDKVYFNKIIIYYLIYIISFEITNYLIKNWGWVETIPNGRGDISKRFMKEYISLDNNSIEKIGVGKIIGIFTTGSIQWLVLLAKCAEKGTELIIAIIFTLYMLNRTDYKYAIIFFVLLIIFFVSSKVLNNKLNSFRKIRYEYRNQITKENIKILMNKFEILQSNKINKEINKIYKETSKLTNINMAMGKYRTYLKRMSPLIMAILLLTSFWYLGNEVLLGNISISLLVGLTGTLIIMERSITSAVGFYVDFSKDFIDVEKFWDFFDKIPDIKGYEEGKKFKYKKGEIEIKDLVFSYIKDKKIFNKFNLNISGGKITALVGNSGSGKSTLVKLISGYIRQDSGKILVDNQDLNETSLKSFYKSIGYLTQEPSVFDGTIRENLLYGISSSKKINKFNNTTKKAYKKEQEKKLSRIIKLAKCEFIYSLEKGIDTEIGEKGIRLSGGQRQRLAIAKIFLKNPKIIILDEPTSALDSFSEEQITKAMHNLFKNRTVIIIAHRLQTVKNADRIIVLEEGNIIEYGNHKYLVNKNGIYKKMLDLQSGF